MMSRLSRLRLTCQDTRVRHAAFGHLRGEDLIDSAIDRILHGAIDLHCHSGPSPFARRIDHAEATRLADAAGFRAIVVKSHHHSTVMDVRAVKPWALDGVGTEVFGGIALNSQVGGLNPHAVALALQLGGKIVWFPTISALQHIDHHAANPGLKFPKSTVSLPPAERIDIIDENGEVLPVVRDILTQIREADAVVAAGHMSPEQILALLTTAKEMGLTRLLVNHPEYVIEAASNDIAMFAGLGAVIEHSLCMYDEDSTFYHWEMSELLKWIALVGPENTSLGSDLGQVNNPLPTESYRKIVGRLLDSGITPEEVRMMVVTNPTRLLGLDSDR